MEVRGSPEWTTRLGGKAGLAPAPWLTFEAGQTGESESLPPFAHDLTGRVETGGDEVIGESLGRHENDPGADDLAIR
jgi:hypothetical protein